jgi:hypothetical protein
VPQASKKEPAFGEDYRLLESGELIQDGDEYYAPALGNWCPTKFGGRMHSDGSENYRRKIEPEPEPEPKPVYRMLEVGELLREDDEVYFKPEGWQPYGGADCKVNPSGINPVGYYRRKIEPEPEPEYYYLGHEDVIEKGDEFYDSFEDVWVKSSYIGRPAGKLITSVPYRRPIKQENVAKEKDYLGHCDCGCHLSNHFLLGVICEECTLQWQDPY